MSVRVRSRETRRVRRSRWGTAEWFRKPLRFALAVTSCLALGVAGADARADDQAAAEELFDRGRKLMESNATLSEACRTLQESLKLMDRGDTLLNLAECHRRQGKTATAWFEFDRALSVGTRVGFSEAVQAATHLRDALAAKLSKLTVTVPPTTAALAGLTVEVDGSPWPRERWNNGVVIDPGSLKVSARAKGYKPFEVQVELGADKDSKSVVVVLEVEPPPPPPAAASSSSTRSRRQAAPGVALDRRRRRRRHRRGGDRLRARLVEREPGAERRLPRAQP